MLRELSIRNFAIIEDLRVRFPVGLIVFSGETGAGKSIIINAVNLLLGGRASAGLIRSGAATAELEALFHVDPESRTAGKMKTRGFDAEEGLLIRRIISRTDRHRIYINGRLSTVQILSELTENLASISGQHAHQGLLREEQHLLLLDQYGGLLQERSAVYRCYHEMVPLITRLHSLQRDLEQENERRELLEFQGEEIRQAAVRPDEDEALELERSRLKNAQSLQQTVYGCIETLYDGQGAVVEHLKAVQNDLEKASNTDPELSKTAERMAGNLLEIEDTVDTLRTYLGGLETDRHRLEAVEERLDLLNRLKRKYGRSLAEVLSHLASIETALSDLQDTSSRIEDVETRISALRDRLTDQALRLSRKRAAAADSLSEKIIEELGSLKMAASRFQVRLREVPADTATDAHFHIDGKAVSDTGIDRATFLIAPNIGESLKPLASIASGGELSRVVLALKAILAETDAVGTVIFDEVDAGIGGEVAATVGRKLVGLAGHHQIFCITHLPQIARYGDHHFRIKKQVSGGRTRTAIEPVSRKERVDEIARMLGGETVTEATIAHARELLGIGDEMN